MLELGLHSKKLRTVVDTIHLSFPGIPIYMKLYVNQLHIEIYSIPLIHLNASTPRTRAVATIGTASNSTVSDPNTNRSLVDWPIGNTSTAPSNRAVHNFADATWTCHSLRYR